MLQTYLSKTTHLVMQGSICIKSVMYNTCMMIVIYTTILWLYRCIWIYHKKVGLIYFIFLCIVKRHSCLIKHQIKRFLFYHQFCLMTELSNGEILPKKKIIYLHQIQKKLSWSHAFFFHIKKIGVCFNKFDFIFDMETIRNELIISLLWNIWALGQNFVLFYSH